MATFIIIAVFVLGTIIGSFLNVIIFRYHTGRGIGGRSACMSCAKKLNWFELIPVISFFAQGGKCFTCRSKISPVYPIVEFLSGFSFLFIFFHQIQIYSFEMTAPFFLSLVYYWLIGSILIMIAAYDFRHKIVPSEPVYTFIALALISPFISKFPGLDLSLLTTLGIDLVLVNLLSGFVLALPFGLIWLFSKGKWMGLGDAKIILGLGFLFGMSGALTSVIFAFWLGAAFSIFIIALNKIGTIKPGNRITLKSEIPFGPFLVLAAFIVYLFNLDLNSIISFF